LEQFRFSEDLDFGSLDKSIELAEVKAVLEEPDFLSIKKDFVSTATIKIEKLQYTGPLGQPNSLKLEIDYLQDVVLPPQEMEYRNVWGVETKVRVMDIKEICAEKIRTISDRARYRDFYDLFLILEKFDFDMEEILDLIQQKEIRNPISKERIQANWQVVSENKEKEVSTIYYSREITDKEIELMFEKLPFTVIEKPV
jgi:predicted nucleotidyltransferase component of viral defense system